MMRVGSGDHMAVSECPECTFHIALPSSLMEGETLDCPDCGAHLRLLQVYPPIFEKTEE
jgi:uncharacterized paraquat-inducible protein A